VVQTCALPISSQSFFTVSQRSAKPPAGKSIRLNCIEFKRSGSISLISSLDSECTCVCNYISDTQYQNYAITSRCDYLTVSNCIIKKPQKCTNTPYLMFDFIYQLDPLHNILVQTSTQDNDHQIVAQVSLHNGKYIQP